MIPSPPVEIELLRKMILIREFDELAIKLRTAGRIYGTVHPYVGEEAIGMAVVNISLITDYDAGVHRGDRGGRCDERAGGLPAERRPGSRRSCST